MFWLQAFRLRVFKVSISLRMYVLVQGLGLRVRGFSVQILLVRFDVSCISWLAGLGFSTSGFGFRIL